MDYGSKSVYSMATIEAAERRLVVSARLVLLAPLSGPLVALDDVPDPVFARRLVGDGVSIDPETSLLLAPCDARVLQVHRAGHAVNLQTAEGVEVMIHVGLDTVELKGEGFLPRVKAGDHVKAGETLIEFAADYVATHARSLLTQIVIPSSERVVAVTARRGRVVAGRDVILELALAGEPAVGDAGTSDAPLVSEPVMLSLATGLHARPAAVVASIAKRFRSRVRLLRGNDAANAKSVTALMGLDIGGPESVRVEASGPDATDALSALVGLIASGLGEEGERGSSVAPAKPAPESAASPRSSDPDVLHGVAASPGLAVGRVFQVRRDEIVVVEAAEAAPQERRRLEHALERARMQLETLQARLRAEADAGKAAIFSAHAELLDDPDVLEIATRAIDRGRSAGAAWRDAVTAHVERLAASRNELLAARANDMRDVGRRVQRLIAGEDAAPAVQTPERAILIAEDLAPSETASLDRTRVLGFCTVAGGATSHVAILARSLDIPAVAGVEARALAIPDGTEVVLDGSQGTLRLYPSDDEIVSIRQRQERVAARRRTDSAEAAKPALTRDGNRIEVVANIGSVADAWQAVSVGGEGVGLLRSEFLFLNRASAPNEDEQFEAYQGVVRALGPQRPLVIRVLDVGGDKPLPYLSVPREENPFLGVRGIRLLLERPEVLRTQLRAILRLSGEGRISVMLPMVATLGEWRAAKAIVEEERAKLGVAPVPLGIMIEVPSAALLADVFAREVDFFSVGTNDLTQYTLAMDRGHPKLAASVDGLDPAVLRLIGQAARAATLHKKWIGVCGGIASDVQAVAILIGLGVTELSVSVPSIPTIKARVRELTLADCRRLAERALEAGTAADVRALLPREV
jgi:phosphoenolpyruvate-protein phosphotransferase